MNIWKDEYKKYGRIIQYGFCDICGQSKIRREKITKKMIKELEKCKGCQMKGHIHWYLL